MILANDEGRYDPHEIHVINTIGDRDMVTQTLGCLLRQWQMDVQDDDKDNDERRNRYYILGISG